MLVLGVVVVVVVRVGRPMGMAVGVIVRMPVGVKVIGYLRIRVDEAGQRVERTGEVAIVLHHDIRRLRQHFCAELVGAENCERARPIDGLGDARRLTQVEIA